MGKELRVTIVQANLHWENKEANLAAFDRRLDGLAGETDLIVLPEMFSTGFSMSAAALAEELPGPTLSWMAAQAARTGAVVSGSIIAREGGGFYNRLIWMRPDGTYDTYDKRHLFTLAGEQQYYQAGRRRLLVDCRGWKVMPLICYDLRFPVWSRNTDAYDLLLYVANWPERRSQAWKALLSARAIENQAFTVGVNRVGPDGNGIYHSGDSTLVDFSGALRYCISHQEGVFTTSISKEEQEEFRQKLRFLDDRDAFQIFETE